MVITEVGFGCLVNKCDCLNLHNIMHTSETFNTKISFADSVKEEV